MMIFNAYPDMSQLTEALSHHWLQSIQNNHGSKPCCFALAGGSTPAPLYRRFSRLLADSGVPPIQLLATDERWVPDQDPQSNEGLLRQCFSTAAPHWSLISLKNQQADPASAQHAVELTLQQRCPEPFTAVILGMGTDGHIASLFPDSVALLNIDSDQSCIAVRHPQSGQARMSLSMARLLRTKAIWLVMSGTEKRAALEQASSKSPVGLLLARALSPVEVFWCP